MYRNKRKFSGFKRKRYSGRFSNVASRLRYLAKGQRMLMRMIEKKIFVNTYSNTPSSAAAGSYNIMSGIAQGSDTNQRLGRKISVTSVQFHGLCSINSAANVTWCRLIFFKDSSYGGVPFSLIASTVTANSPTALKNVTNFSRLQFLFDHLFCLEFVNREQEVYNGFKRFNPPLEISYAGATGGSIDSDKNTIFALAYSNEAVNTPTLKFEFRLRYADA